MSPSFIVVVKTTMTPTWRLLTVRGARRHKTRFYRAQKNCKKENFSNHFLYETIAILSSYQLGSFTHVY